MKVKTLRYRVLALFFLLLAIIMFVWCTESKAASWWDVFKSQKRIACFRHVMLPECTPWLNMQEDRPSLPSPPEPTPPDDPPTPEPPTPEPPGMIDGYQPEGPVSNVPGPEIPGPPTGPGPEMPGPGCREGAK